MDFNLSDITFPNYVTGIQDQSGEWLKGGYDYQTQAPAWVRYFVIKEVRDFNLNSFDWHLVAQGSKESDWFSILKLPNGYEIKVKAQFSQLSEQGQYFFGVQMNWFDLDGNALGNDHIGEAGFRGFSSASGYYPISYGNMDDGNFKAYMILDTVYYPDANPAQGSSNHGLALMLLIGNTEYGYHVEPGSGPVGRDGGGITSVFLSWEDLQKFATYLHAHGEPFNGDPFSDEEFPGEPAGGEDTSGTGGGDGNYDITSDPVDFPPLPTGGALTSGMIKGFVMNSGNLIGLQNKLWDMSFFDIATQFQKLVNQPLDCLISLHCLPFTPTEGTAQNIKLGGFDTTISANRITAQYMEIDAGTYDVKEFYGSALDYDPFTAVEIWVPFVGFRSLKIEDIQNVTLVMKYHVDVMTGDCVAYLKCGDAVMYSWSGNCLAHIPVTSQSSDLLFKSITAAGAIGTGLVTGNPASAAAGAITGAVNVATAKNHYQRSGDMGGSVGLMSEFTPYLIFHRPRQSLAKGYNQFKGYPSNITYSLANLKGYTEVEHVHLTGISGATDAELAEIEDLLKKGVIL